MKKLALSILLTGVLAAGLLAGCGSSSASTAGTAASETGSGASAAQGGTVKVALSLADASDYYIGTMVGAAVESAFKEAGAKTQILDAGSDVQTQINQIQNAITSGVNIIYVFPTGDGPSYTDVLTQAKEAGVKTIISNNYPGDGVADAYVGNDEFEMGVMMAAMVSNWADQTYPDAGEGEVAVLPLESDFNENAIRRCIGMRMVGEKFLREADLANVSFVKKDGDPVTYLDADGKEQNVDEPTGGLILDENGHAQLNPYYNAKIKLVDYSSKGMTGVDATEAQKAVENIVAGGNDNLAAVMSYGDVGAAVDTKVSELIDGGKIKTDKGSFGVFCSDLTDTNRELITNPDSLLKGVMTSGDLIAKLQEDAKALVAGQSVEAYTMMPLSYVTANEAGDDVQSVSYADSPQLPDTAMFFPDSTVNN